MINFPDADDDDDVHVRGPDCGAERVDCFGCVCALQTQKIKYSVFYSGGEVLLNVLRCQLTY